MSSSLFQNRNNMKRVLIITYYWPPAGGSGVQRWVKFSKYLPSQGWQPVIYTPLNPEISSIDETLVNDVPDEAEIIKTSITEPYSIYRKILGSKSSTDIQTLIKGSARTAASTGGEVNPINNTSKGLKQNLSLWIRGNLFIPDPRIWWVRPSVSFLTKYLKEHPVDIIVTTGPPQSMHLIGLGVHKATGIPWIADFRDPWTKIFYYKHLHLNHISDRKHHRLEKQVLDNADAIIAVSPLVQKEFEQMTSTKVHLITNGFDPSDFYIQPDFSRDNYFRIVHTGVFAADGNPEIFWSVLNDHCCNDPDFKENLKICLAGKVDAVILDSIKQNGLMDKTEVMGYLAHNDAIKVQRSANLLLLPLRQEPECKGVLPGKIFEYLAAERPVLGFGQEDGAAAGILSETGAGTMCDWNNRSGMADALEKAWSAKRQHHNHNIEKYTRQNLTKQLVSLFETLI